VIAKLRNIFVLHSQGGAVVQWVERWTCDQ